MLKLGIMIQHLLYVLLFFAHQVVMANELPTSTYYPLQTKYPDTMIYKIDTHEKVVALTFDDGPDEKYTPQILDVLAKPEIKATFFLLGARVDKYQDVARRIHAEGHEIGSHTYWHPQLTKTGVNNLVWELQKNEAAIQSVIGIKTDLFRAPYGALNDELVRKLRDLHYRAVGWSIDSEDWKGLSKDEIKMRVINGLHPGSIILMHSAGNVPGTSDALDELIIYLKKTGYYFITVDNMWKMIYK